MSASSENDESQCLDENLDENSDCASSRASHLQGSKRPRRPTQIRATLWILHGEIIPVLQLTDLMDCHAQEEDQLLQSTLQLEAALGAKFEVLFQTLFDNVSYFVTFCNLVDLMDVAPAATRVKIQVQSFRPVKQATAILALKKLLAGPAVSNFIQGKWDSCDVGGLSVH
jgi:hypothetical protein